MISHSVLNLNVMEKLPRYKRTNKRSSFKDCRKSKSDAKAEGSGKDDREGVKKVKDWFVN